MFEIQLPISNKTLTADVPTTWNDMTAAQAAHVLKVFALPFPFAATALTAFSWKQIQILKALTNWTDADLDEWQAERLQENVPEEIAFIKGVAFGELVFLQDVANMCDILTKNLAKQTEIADEESRYELIPELTKNPYPKIEIATEKGKIKTFYAAKSDEESPFDTMSLDELSQVFTLWESYRDEKNEADFDEMLAIIYRPKRALKERLKKNYDGDIRETLEADRAEVDKRAALFSQHVSDNFRIVLDFHIASCRESIAALYPSVFSRKNELQTQQTGDWLDLIIALADDDFGKKDKIMRSNAHDSLGWADRIREKAKKQVVPTPQ